jgi:hypothetical protein
MSRAAATTCHGPRTHIAADSTVQRTGSDTLYLSVSTLKPDEPRTVADAGFSSSHIYTHLV